MYFIFINVLDFYNTLEMKPFLFVTKSLWVPGVLLMTLETPFRHLFIQQMFIQHLLTAKD